MKPFATSRLLAPVLAGVLAGALAACTSRPLPPVAAFSANGTNASGDGDTAIRVNTGVQVRLDAGASRDPQDATKQQLKYAWRFARLPSGSVAVFDLPTSPTPSFVTDVTGDYTVELVVRAGIFESAPVDLTVSAAACGAQRPVTGVLQFTPAAPGVGTPVQLSAPDAADPDNAAGCDLKQQLSLAWSITAQPAGSHARLNDPTAKKPDFTPDATGAYVIELVVTDPTGLKSDAGRLTINAGVCGGNRPVLGKVQSSNDKPGVGATVQLSVTVTDGDLLDPCNLKQTESYAWSLIEVPLGSQAALNASAVAAPSFKVDASGTYRVRVIVTDSTGLQSDPGDVTVQATTCGGNAPVAFVAVPTFAAIGSPVQLTASVTDDDITLCSLVQTFRYSWRLAAQPGGSSARLNSPGAVSPSFTPDVAGDYAVELVVTDSGGYASLPATATVSVTTCGSGRPSVDALTASPAAPNSGQRVLITPTVSDPDAACANYNPTRTYVWALISSPAGSAAFLRDPSAAVADFGADLPGPYQVALQVADSAGRLSASKVATVLVNPCGFAPPAITSATASDLAPDPGKTVRLSAVVVDSDNGTTCNLGQTVALRWSAISRPPGSGASLSDPAATQPTFTPDVPGTYQFLAVATDSTGLRSAPAFVTLQATVCGSRPPTVTVSPTDLSTQPGTAVALSAIPSDPDSTCGLAESFTYDWRVASSPVASAAAVSDPRSPSPTFTPDVSGAYLLQVSVSDTAGHVSAPAFVRVTAGGCADLPPSVAAVALSQAGLGQTVTASASGVQNGNCAAPGPVTYLWRLSRPPNSQASLSNPGATAPTLVPDVAGDYQVTLAVTNSAGLSSVPVFATLSVPACGASSFGSGSAISFSAADPDGSAIVPNGVPPAVHPNAGSMVALAATIVETSPTCTSLPLTPYQYRWNLASRPAGSTAGLDDPSGPTPGFVPDVPGDYQVALSVTDALGSRSPTLFTTVHSSSCGANRPVVAITPAGPLASVQQRQDLALCIANAGSPACPTGGIATSGDDSCPVRFKPSYRYLWRIAAGPSGGARLGSPTAPSTSFRAGLPGAYRVELVARSSNGTTSDPAAVSLTATACGSHPPVVTGTNTQVNGTVGSRPNVQDDVQITAVTTDPDGACPTPLGASTFTWSLLSAPSGSAVAWSAAGPTLDFHPDVAGSYTFQVTAADQTGLASAPFLVTIGTAACSPTFSFPAPFTAGPAVHKTMSLGLAALADSCVLTPNYTFAWTVLQRPAGSLAQPGAPSTQGSSAAAASTSFTPDIAGRYVFQLSVTDNGGVSTNASATVDVASCGSVLPVLNASCLSSSCTTPAAGDFTASPVHQQVGAIGKTTPDTGDQVALSVPNVDDGNNSTSCGGASVVTPFRYQWALLSAPDGSTARLSSTTIATPTLVPDRAGAFNLSVVVTDALGNASPPSFHTLTTSTCGSNPPTPSIGGLPGGTINPGFALGLTASALDADDSCPPAFAGTGSASAVYSWSVVSTPAGGQVALSAVGTPATFSADRPGAYLIKLTATDGGGLSGSTTATVNVAWCGTAAPALTACAGGCGAGDTAGSPVHQSVGGSGKTNPDTGDQVALTVPAIVDPNASNGTCSPASVVLPYGYKWQLISGPAGSTAQLAAAASPTALLVPDRAGDYRLSVVVTDALGNSSAPATHLLRTSTCGTNRPTVSVTPSPAGAVNSNAAVALTATFTDADDGAGCPARFHNPAGSVGLAWALVSSPSGGRAALTSSSGTSTSFTADGAGTYVVQFTGTDATGLSSSTTAAIAVNACGSSAPLITAVNAGVGRPPVGAQVALVAHSTDGDELAGGVCGGTPLAVDTQFLWTLLSAPAGSNATGTAGFVPADNITIPAPPPTTSTITFRADVAGTYTFSVTARDTAGHSSPPFTILVPTGTCGPDLTLISAGSGTPTVGSTVTLSSTPASPTSTCVGGGPIGFAWSVTGRPSGSSALLSSPAAAAPTFAPDVAGDYRFRLVVTDAGGFSSSAETVISARACTAAPAVAGLSAAPASLAESGTTFTLTPGAVTTGCGAAAGSQVSKFVYGFTSLPPRSRAVIGPGSAPSFVADVPSGTWQISLVVQDDLGNSSAPAYVSVTTNDCGARVPTASVVPSSNSVSAFARVALVASALDNEAGCSAGFGFTNFSYAWSILSRPPGATALLASTTGPTSGFAADLPGGYVVRMVATGANGVASAPVDTAITVGGCGTTPPAPLTQGALPAFTAQQLRYDGASKSSTSLAASTLDTRVPVVLSANVVDGNSACGASSLSLRWLLTGAPSGSTAALSSATSNAARLLPDLPGTYSVQLTATDDLGLTSTTPFSFTTGTCGTNAPAAVNVPAPAISAAQLVFGAVRTSDTNASTRLVVGNPVRLTANVVDLDAQPTCSMLEADTYSWAILSAPPGSRAQLDSAAGTAPAFLPDVSGTYLVQLVATDATGLAGPPTTITLQIDCGTAAPAATDGALPAVAASQAATAVTTASAGATVAVPISHTTLANTSPVGFYPGLPIALSANVTDADTNPAGCNLVQTFRYAWSFAALPAGSRAAFDDPASATPKFVPDLPGRYDVQLTVTDQSGYSTTKVFGLAGGSPLISVNSCGLQPPTASITVTGPTPGTAGAATASALSNDTVSLTGTSTDADTVPLDLATGVGCGLTQPLSYHWAFTSLPAGATSLAFSSAVGATTTFVPPVDGHYLLSLATSDGLLTSAAASLDVTVRTVSFARSTLTVAPSAGSSTPPLANGTDSYDVTLTVRNPAGVAMPGVAATLSVPAAPGGFTNSLRNVSGAVTDASGQITAQVSSTKTSSFVVSADVSSRFSLTTSVSFVTGPPAQLRFRRAVDPTQLAESPLTASGAPVEVRLFDATGNPIVSSAICATYNLTASLPHPPEGSAFGTSTISGTLSIGMSFGGGNCRAVFSDLSIRKWGTGFQLKIAAAPALPPLTATFDLSPNNPPNAPLSVTASGLAAGTDNVQQLTLFATPTSTPNGETTFAVFPSGAQPALLQAVPIAGANTPINFTSLVDATLYSYQVTTEDAAGQDSTTAVSISVFTTPSAPALDDSQTTTTDGSITIHWAPPVSGFGVGTAVAYQKVARATQSNLSDLAPVSVQLSTTSTSYTDNAGLSQGTQYYYVVQAVNDGGRRASNATAAHALVSPPAAPATLSGTPGHNAVLLSWSAVGGADPAVSYNVYVSTPPPGGTAINGTSTTYLATGLTDGTAATFYVTAVNQYGQESLTQSGTFTPTAPVAPTGLTAKGTGGQVTLTWTTSAVDTAGYQVVRATAADCTTGAVALTASAAGPTYVDTPAANTIFYYCVSGSNATVSTAAVVSGEITDPNATCNSASTAAPVCTCNGGYGGNGTTCFGLGLAAGAFHTCSLDSSNALGCWGTNTSGQLGDNTNSDRQARTAVNGGGAWQSVAAGNAHTCGVKTDGTLWCWGANNLGQLGDGTQTQRSAPVRESIGATWTQVAAGGDSTCAVRSTGSVYCWGSNAAGQDGGGNASPALHKDPVRIASSTNWLSVAVGNDHVCSLRSIGGTQLWCWGLGDNGQLGLVASGIKSPAQVGSAADWAMVAAGNQTGCAVKGAGGAAGQLFCWGQVPATSTTAPARIGADSDWGTVSVGDSTVCGVKSPSDAVFCFGSNDHGQLGRNALNLSGSQAPAALNTAQTYTAVATRGLHSCGVRSADGLPECWGSNERSELGLGAGVAGRKLSPAQVGSNSDWKALSASQQATCGLRADQAGQPAQRTLWCAGLNASGEAGASSTLPVQSSARSGTDVDWSSLAGGSAQFLGLKQGSPAPRFFWGDDTNAMSGSGTNTSSTVPTLVNEGATPPAWAQLAAGTSSACGIAGGQLFCWGANSKGEAGGTVGNAISTPAQFGALADWTSVAMGYLTSCGLEGNALSCWGDNSSGQLAKNGGGQQATPNAIAASNGGWTAVAVGSTHACGVDGGQLFCWGSNSKGQLGLGGGGTQTSPKQESTHNNSWATVAAGQSNTCATRTDGTLWCWGLNGNGQLGLGDTNDRQDPIQVGTDANWASVFPARVASGASGFTCALKTTGTLWCWGSNEYGWQGDNSAFRLSPAAVQ